MNLLILEERERINPSLFHLTGRKKEHLVNHLEIYQGRELKAALCNHSMGIAIVRQVNSDFVEIEYKEKEKPVMNALFSGIHLYIAFQRPQTIKKILHLTGCTGIEKIFFFISEKSQKGYLTSPIWKEEALIAELIGGMEQCMNLVQPEFEILLSFPSFENYEKKVLLNPEGSLIQDGYFSAPKQQTAIVMGPEGGFHKNELDKFLDLGFEQRKLSRFMLRTEYALSYLLERLERDR